MSDNTFESLTPKEICYWMFGQLYKDREEAKDWFINIRVVHNCEPTIDPRTGKPLEKTITLFNKNIPVEGFKEDFLRPGGIYDSLYAMNQSATQPGNPYFGVNPRISITGNKKVDVAGSITAYLDLDDNKSYTKEQRAGQIDFWLKCGLWPTFVIESGRGYHPYWVFDKLYPRELVEPVIKRMVALAGCRQGGNTWDITRVLRLPGFLNQKRWFAQDQPLCHLVYPPIEHISQEDNRFTLQRRYTLEELERFPSSETKDIERYVKRAGEMEGNLKDNVYHLVQAAMRHRSNVDIHITAQKLVSAEGEVIATEDLKANPQAYSPKLTSVPPEVNDIPWPKGKKRWMILYCKRGFAGLTPIEEDQIKAATGDPEASASELDYRIMYALVKVGYTREAIREFWDRPGLRLHRPDKEARSPDYWNGTFNKALQAVRNTIEQSLDPVEQVKRSNVANNILVHNHETFFKSGEKVQPLLNGAITFKRRYIDKDATVETDREYYECEVSTPSANGTGGVKKYDLMIPRRIFNAPNDFRKKCHGQIILMTDKGSHLAHLLRHLIYTHSNVPTEKFHSKVVYTEDQFIFPKLTISKDKFETTNTFSLISELQNKFPWHDSFVSEAVSKEKAQAIAREAWPRLLRLHSPMVVSGMIGTIAASGMRAILEEKEICRNFNLPTINVRGTSTKGKSLTVGVLYRLCGIKDRSPVISVKSSAFSLSRIFELSNFIPLVVDEFKEKKETMKYVEQIRELVRRAYTGEMMLRGKSDLSLVGFKVHGAIAVIGEAELERADDVSEFTRTLPINVGDWDVEKSAEHYEFLETFPIENLGPHFYQYLINLDPIKTFQRFQALRKEIEMKIKDSFGTERSRISHNIACIVWGCWIYDSFIQSLDPNLPTMLSTFNLTEQFANYISTNALETGKSLIMHDTTGKRQIVARNEIFEFIETINLMIESKDPTIVNYDDRKVPYIDQEAGHLFLNISLLHKAYVDHCRRQGLTPHSRSKLLSIIRDGEKLKVPWLAHKSRLRKVHDKTTRFAVFSQFNLERSGVWTLNIKESAPTEDENPGSHSMDAQGNQVKKTGQNSDQNLGTQVDQAKTTESDLQDLF